jgi:hypothetical protein
LKFKFVRWKVNLNYSICYWLLFKYIFEQIQKIL